MVSSDTASDFNPPPSLLAPPILFILMDESDFALTLERLQKLCSFVI